MTDNMRSRVLGTILGSVSRGQFPQCEPVAFLYGHVAKEGEAPTHTINGVGYVGWIGPKLPEWDYSHAVITTVPSFGYRTLYFANNAPYFNGSTVDFVSGTQIAQYSMKSDAWEFYNTDTWAGNDADGIDVMWTSHDIYTGDGSALYLAASEPIPVCE